MNIKQIVFEMERYRVDMILSNLELTVIDRPLLEERIITATRRLAVNRLTFKDPNKPTEERTHSGPITVEVSTTVSWWDHAKDELRLLRWAVDRGILKPARWRTKKESAYISNTVVHRHFVQEVTVLDDHREIPRHMQRIEMSYQS